MHAHPFRNGILALAGISCAALFLLPVTGRAWAALGGTLDLTQRDVRVFNNFSAPEANENVVPDPNFPGALGAPLAMWKAVAEWGSRRRADGLGDPTQPGDIGSGGANFDSSWQGLASGVGGIDDNIASTIAGSSLGILAYTEIPISDGWRIRFYDAAGTWMDGPGDLLPIPGHKDIQGVMTHEYGHALGLDHSGFPGLTMYPSDTGTNVEKRSIEADDIAGVQGLYGVASRSKPIIDGYTLSSGVLTVRGSHFSPAGNEVWLTDGSPTADGTPLKVTGLVADTNCREITLALPANAADGDLLVKVPGTDGAALSNAYPFDTTQSSCPLPVIYGTAKTTSQSAIPELFIGGRPRLSTNDFVIGTGGGISGATGFLVSSPRRAAVPFHGGTLYLARPLRRDQRFTFDFLDGITLSVPVTPAMVGTSRCYQMWFQDAGDPSGVGLSNAVEVTFCP